MKPTSPNIQRLKAMAQRCLEQGAFEEGLTYYSQIVQAEPSDAQAHYAQGTILRRLHRPREALAALQRSAELAEAAPPQIETADLLLSVGRANEAIPYCERALRAGPNAFDPNLLMARAMGELGRTDESEPYWAAAQLIESIPGQTAMAKAMYLANNGRFSEAEQAALWAIELAPTRGRAYHALLASRRVTTADRPLIEQIEAMLGRPDIKPEDRIDLSYALGRAHDNLSDFGNAITAFDHANDLQRTLAFGGRSLDRRHISQMVDRQIELLDRPSKAADPSYPTPIFVVGMPRSGTTLVDQILSSHPQIGSAGEQAFWMDYQLYPPTQRHQLRSMYLDLLAFLQPGFPFVVDKNPTNLFVVGLIRLAIPEAKIIGIKRDPVDTALSMWTTQMQTKAPFAFDRANIVFASRECDRLMEHCRRAIPGDHYLEIQYEELAYAPEEGAKSMLQFIGLDWNDRCAHPELNARAVSTPSFWQVRQPVYRSSVGRRKNYEPWLGVFTDLNS